MDRAGRPNAEDVDETSRRRWRAGLNLITLERADLVDDNLGLAGYHPARHDGDTESVSGVPRRHRNPTWAAGKDPPGPVE